MNAYILKNIITGEVLSRVFCHTLAAAQEYFDCLHPYLTSNWMVFQES